MATNWAPMIKRARAKPPTDSTMKIGSTRPSSRLRRRIETGRAVVVVLDPSGGTKPGTVEVVETVEVVVGRGGGAVVAGAAVVGGAVVATVVVVSAGAVVVVVSSGAVVVVVPRIWAAAGEAPLTSNATARTKARTPGSLSAGARWVA